MDIHDWFGLSYSNYLVLDRRYSDPLPGSWHRDIADTLSEMPWNFPGIGAGVRYLALAGTEAPFGELTTADMARLGITSNEASLHAGCDCPSQPQQHDDEADEVFIDRLQAWADARAAHERDELRWQYRGREYTADDRMVFAAESVNRAEQARRTVVHRSLLQSMPTEWQRRLVQLLLAYSEQLGDEPVDYQVRVYDADGVEVPDPVPHYDRGRILITRG